MNRLSYRPDIDGLRAVAVLGVLFFHAGLGCQGGFVGVDVFFVISGFLITSLILRDLREGTFSFADFWARRIRRIVPALAVMTLVVIVVGYFGMFPDYYEALGKQMIALVLCISNVKFWKETGYFDTASDEKPLLHTWSLSVEEQSYFIIPIALFLVFKFRRETFALPLIILTCLGSFTMSVYASYNHPSANFYLLPTRAWELGAGSLLAFAGPINSPKLREVSSCIGLGLIIGCYILFPEDASFPGVAALPPVIGTALIIWSGIGQTNLPAIGRLLTLKTIVGIGLISYSLYLWHWPIFAFQKHLGYSSESQKIQIILLLISFVPAWLSWRFVETPFRRKALLRSRKSILAFGSSLALFGVTVGSVSLASNGNMNRFPKNQISTYLENTNLRESWSYESSIDDLESLSPYIEQPQKASMVFVWGDSHAMHFIPAIKKICKNSNQDLYVATYSSTAPIIGNYHRKNMKYGLNEKAPEWNSKVIVKLLSIVKDYNESILIIGAKWDSYLRDGDSFITPFRKTLLKLSASSIQKIIIMSQVPRFGNDRPSDYIKGFNLPLRRKLEYVPPYMSNDIINEDTSLLEEIISDLKLDTNRFHLLRTSEFSPYRNSDFFPFEDQNGLLVPLYMDSHHLNTRGSLLFTEPLSNIINKR